MSAVQREFSSTYFLFWINVCASQYPFLVYQFFASMYSFFFNFIWEKKETRKIDSTEICSLRMSENHFFYGSDSDLYGFDAGMPVQIYFRGNFDTKMKVWELETSLCKKFVNMEFLWNWQQNISISEFWKNWWKHEYMHTCVFLLFIDTMFSKKNLFYGMSKNFSVFI